MLARKSLRFYSKFFRDHPLEMPGMMVRRFNEAVATAPEGQARTKFGEVNYEIDMTLHRLMKKYYFHTHEMFLEPIFRRYLKPGSIFVDIGANCGYWTAFGTSLVGTSGAVHAFEPVPYYFEFVRRLAADNPSFQIHANNAACGAERGRLQMAAIPPRGDNYANFDTNIGCSSLLPGYLSHEQKLVETIDVDVVRFDDYVRAAKLDPDTIGLIKIDVEGFESFVLDGMPNILGKAGRKVPILCEVLTDTARHPLMNGAKIVGRLEQHGYTCFNATGLQPVEKAKLVFEENILCI